MIRLGPRTVALGNFFDALTNGTPILTLKGSWNARLVEEYGAGLGINEISPELIYKKISKIQDFALRFMGMISF